MLKGLFNGSVILAFAGFVLICSSSPSIPKTAFSKVFDGVSKFTASHTAFLLPRLSVIDGQAYQISLIAMHDYYNTIPAYSLFIR